MQCSWCTTILTLVWEHLLGLILMVIPSCRKHSISSTSCSFPQFPFHSEHTRNWTSSHHVGPPHRWNSKERGVTTHTVDRLCYIIQFAHWLSCFSIVWRWQAYTLQQRVQQDWWMFGLGKVSSIQLYQSYPILPCIFVAVKWGAFVGWS